VASSSSNIMTLDLNPSMSSVDSQHYEVSLISGNQGLFAFDNVNSEPTSSGETIMSSDPGQGDAELVDPFHQRVVQDIHLRTENSRKSGQMIEMTTTSDESNMQQASQRKILSPPSASGKLSSTVKRWPVRRSRLSKASPRDDNIPLSKRCKLVELPQALIVAKLLVFLEARDLVRVSVTCSLLQRAADDPRLWRRLLILDFYASRPFESPDISSGPNPFTEPASLYLPAHAVPSSLGVSYSLLSRNRDLELGHRPRNATSSVPATLPSGPSIQHQQQHQWQQQILPNGAPSTVSTVRGRRRSDGSIASSTLTRSAGSGTSNVTQVTLQSDIEDATVGETSNAVAQESAIERQSQTVESWGVPARNIWNPFQGSSITWPFWKRNSSSAGGSTSRNEQSTIDVGAHAGRSESSLVDSRFAPCREKAIYLQRIHEFEERLRLAEQERILTSEIEALNTKRAMIERSIRLFSLEFTTPMIGICPLLLFLLVALDMDNRLDGSIWIIMIPLLFLFGLFAICIAVGAFLLFKSSDPASLFYGMYGNYRGFIQFWMHKVFREEPVALYSGLVLYLSLVLFVIFIGLQVDQATTWPWIAVFSPFWLMLLILAFSPLLRWCGAHEDMEDFKTPYTVLMFSVWIPVASFGVILPLYLDRYIAPSIAVVLIPIWVFEAELVVFLFITLVQSLYTRKDISDSLLVVFVMLIIFTPLVAFQVMLVIKLEPAGSSVTWVEVFTPLFVWFALCTLYLINVTVYYERPTPADLSSSHPKVLAKLDLHYTFRASHMDSYAEHHNSTPAWPRHRGQSVSAAVLDVRRTMSDRAQTDRFSSLTRS